MKELKFKTNINCGGCIRAVTPFLNNKEGITEWSVDTENPEKILTVKVEDIHPEEIEAIIDEAGFEAKAVS